MFIWGEGSTGRRACANILRWEHVWNVPEKHPGLEREASRAKTRGKGESGRR